MSRPVVDQARAVALAARVRQGEEARDALSRLIRPIAVSEARHLSNQFPLLSRADIESAIAEKTLKGMVSWKPGAGMSVTSYLKRCARNAVYDLARKGRRDADAIVFGEEAVVDLAPEDAALRPADDSRKVRDAARAAYRAVCPRLDEIRCGSLTDGTSRLLSRLAPRLPSLNPWILKPGAYAEPLAKEFGGVYLAVVLWMEENPGRALHTRAAVALKLNHRAVSTIAADVRTSRDAPRKGAR